MGFKLYFSAIKLLQEEFHLLLWSYHAVPSKALYYIDSTFLKAHFFYMSYFPFNQQNGTRSSQKNGKDKEIECNFLIICKYLNLIKKSDDNFHRKQKIYKLLQYEHFEQIMGVCRYVIFIELCMKGDPFACLYREITRVKRIIFNQSGKCADG